MEMTIKFQRDDLLKMCEEQVSKVHPLVPGTFKVHPGSYGIFEVVAEFIPATDEPEGQPVVLHVEEDKP
jgi:hypothetical protein